MYILLIYIEISIFFFMCLICVCIYYLEYVPLEDMWICPKNCGRSYMSAKQLSRHKSECGTPRRFKCDKCFKTFKRNGHLKQHLLSCLNYSTPLFSCNVCLKTFNYKHNWKNHMVLMHNIII